MYVLVDTNIIRGGSSGFSDGFRFLLGSQEFGGYQVCFPELVIQETVANVERIVRTEVGRIQTSIATLNRHLNENFVCPTVGLQVADAVDAYRNKFNALIDDEHCLRMPYPTVEHEKLASMAYLRRKPFDSNGSGYRDALIWETVLGLLAEPEQQIILLAKDNAFSTDKGVLHDELAKDITDLGGSTDQVRVVRELKVFIDDILLAHLEPLYQATAPPDAVVGAHSHEVSPFAIDPIGALDKHDIDWRDVVGLGVQEFHAGAEWQPEELGLPYFYETLWLDYVTHVEILDINKIYQWQTHVFIMDISLELMGEFSAIVHKSDAFIHDEVAIAWIDWDSHYSSASVEAPLQQDIHMLISVDEQGFVTIGVLSVR